MNTDISEGNIMVDNNSMVKYCILGIKNNNIFIVNELLNCDVVDVTECFESEFIKNKSIMSLPHFIRYYISPDFDRCEIYNKVSIVVEEYEKFMKGDNNE